MLSPKNDRVKRLKKLVSQKKVRLSERAFVVEGKVLIEEVNNSDLVIEQLFVGVDPAQADEELIVALSEFSFEVQDCFAIENKVLNSILDTSSPQGSVAVVSMPETSFQDLVPKGHLLVIVDVRDPGNVGTMLRTAEASGAAGVVITGSSVGAYSPKVVRAAAGAIFRMPVVFEPNAEKAIRTISEMGWPTLATVVAEGEQVKSFREVELANSAIVLGNEAHGLAPEIVELCDHQITIPLAGPTESLNVASAAAILCFEALN